ncbi:MAG: YabP/YqfC family sporulation protein [Oscillospiraceae bacterium]|nr:YabP/YqfC family sporulation protein [Oscillospiraceae bacterium]
MGRGRYFLEQLADEADLGAEPMPGQPIVEIAGERRVLIENHHGVKAYSREKILVKVKYGFVSVCGCGLELVHMTKERLVIRGRIDAVTLQRRG